MSIITLKVYPILSKLANSLKVKLYNHNINDTEYTIYNYRIVMH